MLEEFIQVQLPIDSLLLRTWVQCVGVDYIGWQMMVPLSEDTLRSLYL